MGNYNELYHKADTLMRSALKKYSEGNYEGGNHDRAEANRLFDQAENYVNSEAGKLSIMYGENRNFGIIYKTIEGNAQSLYENKKSNKALAKIAKCIKENRVLKTQFDVYNALVYPKKVANAQAYINEVTLLIPTIGKEEIKENNEKLIKLIQNLGLNEAVDINDDTMKLLESVEYVTLNRKNFSNINEHLNAYECITEHINKVCKGNSNLSKTVDEVYNEGIDKISESFENNLTEEERNFINEISSKTQDEQKAILEDKKNAVLAKVKTKIGTSTGDVREKWEKINESISSIEYDEKTVLSKLAELDEIGNTISE